MQLSDAIKSGDLFFAYLMILIPWSIDYCKIYLGS